MNFAKNLKRIRRQHKISQVELAKRTGLTRSMVASYEQGVAEPTLCNLVKIAKLLDVSLNEIIV